METRSSKKLGDNFNGDRGGAQGADLGGRGSAHGACSEGDAHGVGFRVDGAKNLGSVVEEQRGAHDVGIVGALLIKQGERRGFGEESIGDATKGPMGGGAMAGEGAMGSTQCRREDTMIEGPMFGAKRLGGNLSDFGGLGFALDDNDSEISAGPVTGDASVSMLHDVKLAKERLWSFVTRTEVEEVASRGPEGIVDTTVKGFALIAAALPCLFTSTLKIREALDGQEVERQARKAAEEQLELERQTRENAAEHLRLAHERAIILETELQASHGRTAQLEVDLRAALERATRAETYSMKMEKERDAVERAKASAFIDGYEEFKRKVSRAFPAYDFSDFLPYEAPETDDEEASYDGSGDSE